MSLTKLLFRFTGRLPGCLCEQSLMHFGEEAEQGRTPHQDILQLAGSIGHAGVEAMSPDIGHACK